MTAVGERYAPGSVLLAGYAGQALSCAAVAIALFADACPLIVYVLLLGPSIVFTITRPTQSSFAPAVARTPEELTATNVASGWIESVSMLVAPALAGVVLAVWSETAVFALAAAGCAFGAALVLPLRNVAPPVPRSEHGDRDGARLGGALSSVRRDPEAAMLVSLLGAQGVAVGALGVLSVEYAQHVLHRGGDWVGYLNAAFGAGGVIAVVMTARLVGKARLIGPLVLDMRRRDPPACSRHSRPTTARHRPPRDRAGGRGCAPALDASLRAAASTHARVTRAGSRTAPTPSGSRRNPPGR
jgi:Major Facilitator Superfamily